MRVCILPMALAVLALGGCSLLLGTDDLAGDQGPGNVDGGGTTDGGGPSPGNDSSASTTDSAADGGDGGKRPVRPLVFVQSLDGWKTRVDGFFELTFQNSRHKHLTEWFDLTGAGASPNLGGTPALYEAPRAFVSTACNGWCDDNATAGDTGVVDFFDETPVFVTFNTYVHHLGASNVDVKRWARFTVHATGRVVVETELANPAAPSWTASEWSYHDVQLDENAGFQRMELPDKSAFAFFRPGGTSMTVINQAAETATSGGDHEVRWTMGSRLFAQSEGVMKLGELRFGATQTDVADRVNDVRNPSIEVLGGGNAAASTYVLAKGTYSIEATSGTLTFGLGPTRTRFDPTFEITSFSSATWKLSLDGVVIASAQAPVTEHAVAKYDGGNQRLVVAYFGTIPANAPAAKRTFVLER